MAILRTFHWVQGPLRLFRQTPPGFRWGLKISEQISVPVWPVHPRYGALAGLTNPAFLDANLLARSFLKPLEPFRAKVGVLIFEFGAIVQKSFVSTEDLVKALDRFLLTLPDGWRFAVEIRNSELLDTRYFDCLKAHNVAHVFNSWTRMPGIQEQLAIPDSLTSDLIVTRALLKPGRTYEDAVRTFSPYDRVSEVNEEVRNGLREIVDFAIADGRPAFIFVNNRLEGNSPMTIAAIID